MLHYQFDKKRAEHRIKRAAFFIIIRFKIYFLRRYGVDRGVDGRLALHIKNSFTYTARPFKLVAEYQLTKVLKEFLGQWSWKET